MRASLRVEVLERELKQLLRNYEQAQINAANQMRRANDAERRHTEVVNLLVAAGLIPEVLLSDERTLHADTVRAYIALKNTETEDKQHDSKS